MKISISNIAWDRNLFPYFLDFIKSKGCSGVEIAPSCVWDEPIKSSKSLAELSQCSLCVG